MHRLVKTLALAAPLFSAALFASNPADACGGCFVPPSSSTVVSGHRMALSVSTKQTVLWDQIQYQGDPEDFSWVLPIKPGARIEQASDEWFETLEAATVTTVQAPPLNCGGGGDTFGCGSSSGRSFAQSAGGDESGKNDVIVVHQETVGPYESVTLSSKNPTALADWLEGHGYAVPDDIQPTISAYVKEGFDFIALKLIPGNGVSLMSPVRVITQGASPVLPLRMVAAGTGPFTSIVLYVIGEGRWTTQNFPMVEVPLTDLTWDGATNESNYATLRDQTLGLDNGRTWITSYSQNNAFFGFSEEFGTGGIGFTYLEQVVDDEGSNYSEYDACRSKMDTARLASGTVVDTCDPDTEVCGAVGPGEIDARDFNCGELTDLGTALVGMHPGDVWVSRLEANLPRAALDADLLLSAASAQTEVDNFHVTPKTSNYECPSAPVGPSSFSNSGKGTPSGNGTAFVLVGLGAMAALLAARRGRGLVRA